jgi:hypothetical protein
VKVEVEIETNGAPDLGVAPGVLNAAIGIGPV